jgi:hypothetical protein
MLEALKQPSGRNAALFFIPQHVFAVMAQKSN